MLIATHDGSFHADETIACAILTYLYENANIIRSRDPQELEQADLVIDVSGLNDDKHFDHHSNDFTQCRPNGICYATAGLMWEKFGHDFLRKVCLKHELNFADAILAQAKARIDVEIMQMIDLNDNGQLNAYLNTTIALQDDGQRRVFNDLNAFYQHDPSIPYIVAMQNLPAATVSEQHKAFLATVKMLRHILVNAAINAVHTEAGIAKILALYDGSPMLIMHEKLPWTAAVLSHPNVFAHCSLAIYPDRKRGWRVQSLPMSLSERFRNRVTAPASWCGLNDEALDAATGLSGTIFVHKSGFTGGAMDFDTNLELAKCWLAQGRWDPKWQEQQKQ